MARIAYVNGAFQPFAEATVQIEDRGYQFADGVYEVVLVVDGKLWDAEGHFKRWRRSLDMLSIKPPISERAIPSVIKRLLKVNRLSTALVYMQATRGVAPRNHPFPEAAIPTLTMTARRYNLDASNALAKRGASVVTTADNRWKRVDIKTISLLPNVLAKEDARRQGADEAWLIGDTGVTEGSSTNAWIVTKEGVLVTHPLGTEILGGIKRQTVKDCASELQYKIEERVFSVEEALHAKEAFFTSATSLVMPVVRINNSKIGGGEPGPIAARLRQAYIDRCQ